MKVLFLLFLVSITCSNFNFIDIQRVQIYNLSLTKLNSSTDEDHFYFHHVSKYRDFFYLALYDNGYDMNKISYCSTNISTYWKIDDCKFNLIEPQDKDSRNNTSGIIYYYIIPSIPDDQDLIIKYSGKNGNGIFKAAGSYRSFIERLNVVGSNYDITTFENSNNYFYTNIGGLTSKYLYLYFEDKHKSLEDPIYYCFTKYDPENNYSLAKNCNYSSVKIDEKDPVGGYDFVYKVEIGSKSGNILVKYFVNSSKGWLKVSARTSKFLSRVAIAFIVIGCLVFVGIIIVLIVYGCKKRIARNQAYIPDQPAVIDSTPNDPFMTKTNDIQPINL